ncbi:AraC family transcriptional regulator [Piscinibacter sp. XHJ-5]|uniref:AraC family transcriptional regulator n=1 Tax=Piscinibacter sp. XHJ-5 TaxID=3037797 RepID=UPI002452AE73|nr:AraC family transcriptional regulator [Piscinibacter sp. XHJ-5]
MSSATRPASPFRPERVAATPMAFVRAILLGYEKYGMDPSEALRQAQITPAQLRKSDARITAAQFEVISALAMQQLDDEALGWFSRRLPWGTYGMLCRASIGSPNLGVALARWCRHHRLLTEDLLLSLQARGDAARFALEESRRFGAMREFCLVTSLRFMHGFACWAIDSRIPLRETSFAFAAPPHHDVYPHLFPGPVYFDAPSTALVFDAQYLEMPLRRDEAALRTMLQRALPLTILQYRRDRLLVQRVRELLRTRAADLVNAEALAEALHISTRTLHRQLQEEGAALQALKDEARRDQAIDRLRRTARPVKQIALEVGFGNEKSFARAFKQWTGRSPSDFRRQAGPR